MPKPTRKDTIIVVVPGIAERFSNIENCVTLQAPAEITEGWVREVKTRARAWIVYRNEDEKKAEEIARRVGRARSCRVLVTETDITNDPLGMLWSAQLASESFVRTIYTPSDPVYDVLAAKAGKGITPGLRVPDPVIDDVTGTLLPANIYILFAGQKQGKTRLTASHLAVPLAQSGHKVLFWSLEIDPEEFHEYTLVPILLRRERPEGGWTKADIEEARRLHPPALYAGQSVPGLSYEAAIRQAQEECEVLGVDLLVVDNFGFVVRGGHVQNAYEAEGNLSKLLKELACILEIPIWVICHPRKEGDKDEKDAPPTLYDVKGNSAMVSDATGIFCMHRPRINDPENPVVQRRSPVTYLYAVAGRNRADGLHNELYFEGGNFRWRRASGEEILAGLPDHGRYGERKAGIRVYASPTCPKAAPVPGAPKPR